MCVLVYNFTTLSTLILCIAVGMTVGYVQKFGLVELKSTRSVVRLLAVRLMILQLLDL